jgi:hypothetical protein
MEGNNLEREAIRRAARTWDGASPLELRNDAQTDAEEDTGFADTVPESPFPEIEGDIPEGSYVIETPAPAAGQGASAELPTIDEALLDEPATSKIVNPATESYHSVHTPDRGLTQRQAPYAYTPVETAPAPAETYSPAKGGVDVRFDSKGRLKKAPFWKRLLGGE